MVDTISHLTYVLKGFIELCRSFFNFLPSIKRCNSLQIVLMSMARFQNEVIEILMELVRLFTKEGLVRVDLRS